MATSALMIARDKETGTAAAAAAASLAAAAQAESITIGRRPKPHAAKAPALGVHGETVGTGGEAAAQHFFGVSSTRQTTQDG